MNTLELFSGTASFTSACVEIEKERNGTERNGTERNGQHFTLDFRSKFNPTFCMDIMAFTPEMLRGVPIDVIWASPDCRYFSVAVLSQNWAKRGPLYIPKHDKVWQALEWLDKTLALIAEIRPKYFFIENPRGMMRNVDVMRAIPRHTVTYCQYGDTRMKPTDIWTNCDTWTPRPACKNGDPCHEPAPRGSKCGTQGLKDATERAKIPSELCKEIIRACYKGLYD